MTDRTKDASENCRLRQNIEIVPFAPSFKDTWNSFIEMSNNGSEFHRTDFLDYHHESKFDFRYLMFYHEGKLVSVLPGCVRKTYCRRLQVPDPDSTGSDPTSTITKSFR